jgi:hypothetical protein
MIVALSLVYLPIGAPQAAQQYEQAKLESFVTAAIAVNQLVEQWTPRIRGAQNETEAAQLREQANHELVAAIQQSNGISLDEYRQISEAAQKDPTLMARITEIYNNRQAQAQPAQPQTTQPGKSQTQ